MICLQTYVPNPPCQLSLWEETGVPGENPRLSAERFLLFSHEDWVRVTMEKFSLRFEPATLEHSRTQSPSYARSTERDRGALAKSISNWHLIGYNEGYCSNTRYILLPWFYGIRFWIWPEPLVAPRVRRALGTRMTLEVKGKCANHFASEVP
jgi:hypothetical protein